jgi:hypothetical protein
VENADFERWMKALGTEDAGFETLPAGAIWWRAQLRRRLSQQAELTRPIRLVECGAIVLCGLAAAGLTASVGAPLIAALVPAGLAVAGAGMFAWRTPPA